MKKSLAVHIFWNIVKPFRKLYWFTFRPKAYGVKCLIQCQNMFLFVRNSYGRKLWTIPGGAIDKGETAEDAVKREVQEEIGVFLTKVHFIGTYMSEREYKRDTVYCYSAMVSDILINPNPQEVEEVRWMMFNELPANRSFAIQEIINLYNKKTT